VGKGKVDITEREKKKPTLADDGEEMRVGEIG